MKEEIILIGGGGHCKSCIDVIEQEGTFNIAGIVDVSENLNQKILGYKFIATDNDLPQVVNEYKNCLITIGQIKSPDIRIRLFETVKNLGAMLPVVISPLSYVSKYARIEEGTIVMHNALINASVNIGKNCIINSKALVEHDAFIEDHCHISTGAIINGGVRVGSGTFIGSNAVTREFITVNAYSVIGCGERIIRNVPSESKIQR